MLGKILYIIGWSLSNLYLKLYHRCSVYGRNRIPKERKGMLIAPNHASFIDPPAVGASLFFPIWFLARTTLFNNKYFGWLIGQVNSIPISRERLDLKTIRAVKQLCSEGKSVLIFPEGTRSKDGNLQKGLAGIGFFVDKIGADVLPIYIDNSFNAFSKNSKWPKPVKVRVNIGEPIKVEKWKNLEKGKEKYQIIADDIMKEITKLKDELNHENFNHE